MSGIGKENNWAAKKYATAALFDMEFTQTDARRITDAWQIVLRTPIVLIS